MKKFFFLTISLFFAISATWGAEEPSAQLAKANQAYQAGQFKEAIKKYESLLQQGYQSLAIYYNLGNSYYRVGNVGKAVLYYERALLLAPNDADVKHNLEVVRHRLPDKIEPLPTFFLAKWWNACSGLLSSNTWSILSVASLWMSMAGLSLWLLGKVRRYKKGGFILGIGLLVGSVLSFALASAREQLLHHSNRAVIIQAEISLHNAPDPKSTVVLPLHAGTTIRFLDKIGDWYKVTLKNGEQGWVKKGSFERI